MSVTALTKSSRYPLNVVQDKIQQTRYRIHGETSNGTLHRAFDLSNSASQIGGGLSQSDESFVLKNDNESINSANRHIVDGETIESTSTDITPISCDQNEGTIWHDSKWFREHLGRPLVLGLREIVAKQPRDPVDYLAHSLLNYRSSQVMSKHRRQELTLRRSQLQRSESEKMLIKQVKDKCEYQIENDDESGELDDWNFRNYNQT